jgi:hypothetical protein
MKITKIGDATVRLYSTSLEERLQVLATTPYYNREED